MVEQGRQDQAETLRDMPQDVLGAKQPGATVQRALWAVTNHPEIPLDTLIHTLALQPDEVAQLQTKLCVENFVELLRSDPESLPGVPTDAAIIANSQDLQRFGQVELSTAERQGFLEIWRFTHVRGLMSGHSRSELDQLRQESRAFMDEPEIAADRYDALRFILIAAGSEAGERYYQGEKEENIVD